MEKVGQPDQIGGLNINFVTFFSFSSDKELFDGKMKLKEMKRQKRNIIDGTLNAQKDSILMKIQEIM